MGGGELPWVRKVSGGWIVDICKREIEVESKLFRIELFSIYTLAFR